MRGLARLTLSSKMNRVLFSLTVLCCLGAALCASPSSHDHDRKLCRAHGEECNSSLSPIYQTRCCGGLSCDYSNALGIGGSGRCRPNSPYNYSPNPSYSPNPYSYNPNPPYRYSYSP